MSSHMVASMSALVELNTLEILVVVDNEVDPLSSYQHPGLKVSGQLLDVAKRAPLHRDHDRANAQNELRFHNICCGAHGLSLMIVG